MSITHSAAKRLRQNKKRTRRNSLLRSKLDTAKKSIQKNIIQGKKDSLTQQLRELSSLVDKMKQKGTLKRNTAARIKSRIARSTKKTTA